MPQPILAFVIPLSTPESAPPGTWPAPPGLAPGHPWLPGAIGGGHPAQPIYHPDKPLPGEPGYGEPPAAKPPGAANLPPIIVWIPGVGWIRATPGVPEKPTPAPTPPTPTPTTQPKTP